MNLNQRIRHWNHRRIDKMRFFKLQLTYFIFKNFNRFPVENENQPMLVLRLDDKLGDGITATGFFRELKKSNPGRKLFVVSGPATAGLYSDLDFIDEVFVARKGILNTLGLYFKLRKQNYSVIINTSHILNPRVIFLVSLLRANKKIGFENSNYVIFSEVLKINFKTEHVTDRYRNLLKMLGVSTQDLTYELKIRGDSVQQAQKALFPLRQKKKPVILLNSFAGGRLRNFTRETTLALVRKISDKFPEAVVISAANAGDHSLLQEWIPAEMLATGKWVHLAELSTVEQNIALASLCDVIVTPDTAWVHIASALKQKLIAVYREDHDLVENNSVIWAPYGTEFKTLIAPYRADCPDDINTFNDDEVVSQLKQILALSG